MVKIEEKIYGDSSYGDEHVTEQIFKTALELGWSPSCEDEDLVYEALIYLNEKRCDDRHYWGFLFEDFGYFRIEYDDEWFQIEGDD